jgi:hypothetical protein
MHVDGRSGDASQARRAPDVIDMGMGYGDDFDGQRVALENFQNSIDFFARVDDDGFAGRFVADDRAVAAEHADGDDFVDQANCILLR